MKHEEPGSRFFMFHVYASRFNFHGKIKRQPARFPLPRHQRDPHQALAEPRRLGPILGRDRRRLSQPHARPARAALADGSHRRRQGDLDVDSHHTVEDVAIVLGQALEKALADKRGIHRYGWAIVPMDESLAQVAIDLSGRPAFVFNVTFKGGQIGTFPTELIEEFFKAFANSAKLNLHVTVPYGTNNHHIAEAIFKATARALRQAVSPDPRNNDVPSTKGSLNG